MGKNNLEALRIDELHEAISELFQSLVKIYYEQDKDKKVFEPSHDKTNKMACAPSEDSDQPGIRPV